MEDLSQKFRKLLRGKYLFHLHTNYTDGSSKVSDYCKFALDSHYKHLIFTEHVREKLLYNFENYIKDIDLARKKFTGLDLWLGVEAKVLPNGKLDLPKEFLSEIQVVGIACHSFKGSENDYFGSLKKIFTERKIKNKIKVWLHPSSFFIKNKIADADSKLEKMLKLALKNNIFIEFNREYDVKFLKIIKAVARENLIFGLNAHFAENIDDFFK